MANAHGGKRPGAGRKPKAITASEKIQLRLTADERRAWEQRATAAEQSLSEWIRERCNASR